MCDNHDVQQDQVSKNKVIRALGAWEGIGMLYIFQTFSNTVNVL